MTDKTQPDAGSTHIIRYALELGLLWIDGDGRNKVREALAALDALEAKLASIGAGGVQALSAAPAVAAPKPTCGKCKGLGYYDEGHEYEDGTMGGGNYVECDRCDPFYREICDDGQRCPHGCRKSEPCHTAP